jgi:hypothetical protein
MDPNQHQYAYPVQYNANGVPMNPYVPPIQSYPLPQVDATYTPSTYGGISIIPLTPEKPANYPSPTFSEEARASDLLENEIRADSILKGVHIRRFKHRVVLLQEEQDVQLFDKIVIHAHQNPQSTRAEAMELFLAMDHSDAIINIVYEHNIEAVITYSTISKSDSSTEDKRPMYRSQFIEQLLKKRLFLVLEISKMNEEDRFLSLYGSFEILALQAEAQQFRFQLNVEAIKKHIPEFDTNHQSRASLAHKPLEFLTDLVVHFSSEKRSVPFEYEKLQDFKEGDMDRLGARVKDKFFSPENRIQLLHTIVTNSYIKLKHNSSRRSSIRELISLKIVTDYYFLHDHRIPGDSYEIGDDIRHRMKKWSSKLSYESIPLIEIRRYFGENVAFYFAWLDFYTKWFRSLSIIGMITFVFGIVRYATGRNSFLIVILDNESTSYFAFLISIWSLFFLKFWKRRANYLKFVWDMDNYDTSDRVRVEWIATRKRISPVTGKKELYEPLWIRESKRLVAAFTMFVAFAGLCAFIGANLAFTGWLFNSSVIPGNVSGVVGTALFTVLQIGLVAPVYSIMVVALNNFENYRTQTQYLSNLVWKQFIMCFVNSFGMLYFTSMVKPIVDELDPNVKYFGYYVTKCSKTNGFSSCFSDLAISIAIVFGVQQFLYTGFQLLYPYLTTWWSKRSSKDKTEEKEKQPLPYYMKQFFLAPVTIDLLSSEYSTKMIQLGYVLLFSAPFPLAPVLAWFNNIVEIRVDLWKFLKLYRRPFVETADAIGAWQQIMTGLVYLSTISNSIIIAFTSHTLHNYFSSISDNPLSWKLGFIIVFEVLSTHIAFIVVARHNYR